MILRKTLKQKQSLSPCPSSNEFEDLFGMQASNIMQDLVLKPALNVEKKK